MSPRTPAMGTCRDVPLVYSHSSLLCLQLPMSDNFFLSPVCYPRNLSAITAGLRVGQWPVASWHWSCWTCEKLLTASHRSSCYHPLLPKPGHTNQIQWCAIPFSGITLITLILALCVWPFQCQPWLSNSLFNVNLCRKQDGQGLLNTCGTLPLSSCPSLTVQRAQQEEQASLRGKHYRNP